MYVISKLRCRTLQSAILTLCNTSMARRRTITVAPWTPWTPCLSQTVSIADVSSYNLSLPLSLFPAAHCDERRHVRPAPHRQDDGRQHARQAPPGCNGGRSHVHPEPPRAIDHDGDHRPVPPTPLGHGGEHPHCLELIVKPSGCHCTDGHVPSRVFTEDQNISQSADSP